jgi:hypothetical protein
MTDLLKDEKEVTKTATVETTVEPAMAAAVSIWWRDALILTAFATCVSVLGAIGLSCIFKAPEEWQLPKEVIGIIGGLATNLLTGYFALQMGGRK